MANRLLGRLNVRNMEFGGPGSIYGTVKEATLPVYSPLARRVRLHCKKSGVLVDETWSSVAGDYAFHRLSTTIEFFVLAQDHEGMYNSCVQDSVLAVRMT